MPISDKQIQIINAWLLEHPEGLVRAQEFLNFLSISEPYLHEKAVMPIADYFALRNNLYENRSKLVPIYFKDSPGHSFFDKQQLFKRAAETTQPVMQDAPIQTALHNFFSSAVYNKEGISPALLSLYNPTVGAGKKATVLAQKSPPGWLQRAQNIGAYIIYHNGSNWALERIGEDGRLHPTGVKIHTMINAAKLEKYTASDHSTDTTELLNTMPELYSLGGSWQFYALETAIKLADVANAKMFIDHFIQTEGLRSDMIRSLNTQVRGRPLYLLACVCSIDNVLQFSDIELDPDKLNENWLEIVCYFVEKLGLDLSKPLDMPVEFGGSGRPPTAIEYIRGVHQATAAKDKNWLTPRQCAKMEMMIAGIEKIIQSSQKRKHEKAEARDENKESVSLHADPRFRYYQRETLAYLESQLEALKEPQTQQHYLNFIDASKQITGCSRRPISATQFDALKVELSNPYNEEASFILDTPVITFLALNDPQQTISKKFASATTSQFRGEQQFQALQLLMSSMHPDEVAKKAVQTAPTKLKQKR